MKLSKDKEHLVLDNLKLVDHLVLKLGVVPNSEQHKELRCVGRIGLVKAAIGYDESKKNKFATYAATCINNEIFMHFRKAKKQAKDISLDAPIAVDGKGNEITLGETIASPNSNFVEEIGINEDFIKLISVVLNYLNSRERLIMLYQIAGVSQCEIAGILNLSQSHISRLGKKIIDKVKNAVKSLTHYKEVFSMSRSDEMYKITFASKDISKFNQIFATFLQNVTSAETLPDFKISCNKERIIVQVSAQLESFAFIAKIIQQIDNFSMTFLSNKDTLLEENNIPQAVKLDESDEKESDEILEDAAETDDTEKAEGMKETENDEVEQIISDNLSSSMEEDKCPFKKANSTVKRGSQLKQVREYMLSLDSFTVKELRQKFPDLPAITVNNAVATAKTKGLITSSGEKAKYIVNKT